MDVKACFCLLDSAVNSIYPILTCVVLISPCVPFLSSLSSHGKTRTSHQHRTFLEGDFFLVPKSYFGHFYLFGFVVLIFLASSVTLSVLLLGLHLLRRLHECVYVHKWRHDSMMHLAAYGMGMLHYLLLPLSFVDLQCRYLGAELPRLGLVDCLGTIVCVYGQYQQHRHHVILASHNTKVYSLPSGGWFSCICCAHYTCEILIYLGFALLLRGGARPILLLVWVTANLAISARRSTLWYSANCPAGIGSRSAIFPFVY